MYLLIIGIIQMYIVCKASLGHSIKPGLDPGLQIKIAIKKVNENSDRIKKDSNI